MRTPFAILLFTALLSACYAPRRPAPPPPTDPAIFNDEPVVIGSPGNPAFYEILGQRYHVQTTRKGHRERGVASWYGDPFHGRRTASGEIYDMYQMTAAHRTLPLPTWAEVTNLKNGAKIIVKINDRGPFAHNRIIDLSYAAAKKLDMIEAGTTLVEVRALGTPASDAPPQESASAANANDSSSSAALFVQVGAFGDERNAQRLQRKLTAEGISGVNVVKDGPDASPHRVRIGPVAAVEDYDSLVAQLATLGITQTRIVSDPHFQ